MRNEITRMPKNFVFIIIDLLLLTRSAPEGGIALTWNDLVLGSDLLVRRRGNARAEFSVRWNLSYVFEGS